MLEPPRGEHTEFVKMTQRVNVKDDPQREFEIQSVTYKHPLNIIIQNHSLTWDSNGFTIVTDYPSVVNRGTDYALKPSELELTFHRVHSIFDLPPKYEAVYCVENPPPYTDITYTAKGREREVHTTTDETTGSTNTTYGEWYEQSYTWVDRVYTNLEAQQRLILDAVYRSEAYKKANP